MRAGRRGLAPEGGGARGRRAIDEDEVVADRAPEGVGQPPLPPGGAHELDLGPGEVGRRGRAGQARHHRGSHDLLEAGLADHELVGRGPQGTVVQPQAGGGVGLRIRVHDEQAVAP